MSPRPLRPLFLPGIALALLAGCSGEVAGGPPMSGLPGSTGGVINAGGANPGVSGGGGSSGTVTGTGGSGQVGGTVNPPAGNAGMSPTGGTAGTPPVGATGGTVAPSACVDPTAIAPGTSPIRRLTKFEYNTTVADPTFLNDTTNPAYAFPSEVIGDGAASMDTAAHPLNTFGNDARQQPVSSLLASEYQKVAEGIAQRATGTPEALARLGACAATVTPETQESCARTIIEGFATRAYRRPLVAGELDELVLLHNEIQTTTTFATGIAAVIEAILAGPEFLYRVELGTPDAVRPDLKRPTGYEMATRLSYMFWGTLPDQALLTAAANGELSTSAGVLAHAQRLLDDTRSRGIVRFFFDSYLPISAITDISRDTVQYPTFTPAIAALMQQETRTFLEYEIFGGGSGTWPGILTAPYTFMNQTLAAYYGMPGVVGDAFVLTNLDTTQRLGLLTQGAMMTGLTPTNFTNPVRRGGFIVRDLMCRDIKLPTDPAILAQVKEPEPYSAPTARERYTIHSANIVCAGCHAQMDPMGFSLENYDAVGLYRTVEVSRDALGNVVSTAINTAGDIPGMTDGAITGAIQLAQKLAQNTEALGCLPQHWLNYAYGRTLGTGDECTKEKVKTAFQQSGYNVKQLLLAATQTDSFLYLAVQP